MKKWEVVQGRKSNDDKILKYHGSAGSFEDVAKMCIFFMRNEDNLYPPSMGYKGAEYFKDYIKETLQTRQVPSSKKYQTNKGLTKV